MDAPLWKLLLAAVESGAATPSTEAVRAAVEADRRGGAAVRGRRAGSHRGAPCGCVLGQARRTACGHGEGGA